MINKGIRRSGNDAADASFRESTWHDAKESMHMERLIKTAQPSHMQVS